MTNLPVTTKARQEMSNAQDETPTNAMWAFNKYGMPVDVWAVDHMQGTLRIHELAYAESVGATDLYDWRISND